MRNIDGKFYAFLNSCSHRHCLITDLAQGNDPRFACQYHGWEYGADGYTRKIPEAQCFRPFDRERAKLKQFRLEMCGDLIFVSLADEGPSLREFIGAETFSLFERRFARPYEQNWRWEAELDGNWKLPIENTVESYHILEVHANSFAGVYPQEQWMEHELEHAQTTLRYDSSHEGWIATMQRFALWVLGGELTFRYSHQVVHPNLVFCTTDMFAYVQEIIPCGPDRSRTVLNMYSFRGERRDPFRRWYGRMCGKELKKGILKIMLEDASIYGQQQRGIAASVYQGCIGTREERIYAFHKYILDECYDAAESRSAAKQSNGEAIVDGPAATHRPR